MATTYNDIYQGLNSAVKGITEAVFPVERPSSVKDSLNNFIVITVASGLINMEIGDADDYNMQKSIIRITVFVRDTVTASNPNNMRVPMISSMIDSVRKIFPIVDKAHGFVARRPTPLPPMSDGIGFHYSIIEAVLETI